MIQSFSFFISLGKKMSFSGVFSIFFSLCLVLRIAPGKIDKHMPNSDILGVYTFNTSLGPSPYN